MSEETKKLNESQHGLEEVEVSEQKELPPLKYDEALKACEKHLTEIVNIVNLVETPIEAIVLTHMIIREIATHSRITGYGVMGILEYVKSEIFALIQAMNIQRAKEAKIKKATRQYMA